VVSFVGIGNRCGGLLSSDFSVCDHSDGGVDEKEGQ